MKILVTGAGGMVGRCVVHHCYTLGDEVFPRDRITLDITDEIGVRAACERDRPDVIINCAAWTDVDGCETDRARAVAINALGPEVLAVCSRMIGASLITISTDYVFDGKKIGFYTQRDDPYPISSYGESKLAGERRAQSASARVIVVRTGFIFGNGGNNFLSTMIDRYRRGERLNVIEDAYGTPTAAIDLATRIRELAQLDLPGVYHVVNAGGGASYLDFARAAVDLIGGDASNLVPVRVDALQRPAPRPRNCRLRCLFSEALGLSPLPHWKQSLKNFAIGRVAAATEIGRV